MTRTHSAAVVFQVGLMLATTSPRSLAGSRTGAALWVSTAVHLVEGDLRDAGGLFPAPHTPLPGILAVDEPRAIVWAYSPRRLSALDVAGNVLVSVPAPPPTLDRLFDITVVTTRRRERSPAAERLAAGDEVRGMRPSFVVSMSKDLDGVLQGVVEAVPIARKKAFRGRGRLGAVIEAMFRRMDCGDWKVGTSRRHVHRA